MTKPHDIWVSQVHQLLQAGYGIEDIALKLKCSPSKVRGEVQMLRGLGVLEYVLGVA